MIEHGGNRAKYASELGVAPEEILDFSVNLHPDGMPPGLFPACFRALDFLEEYPEPHAESLSRAAAEKWGLAPENILFGNGSGELLSLYPRRKKFERGVVVAPGYLEYAESCRACGLAVTEYPLREENDFTLSADSFGAFLRPGDLAFLGNPGNPVGTALPAETLRKLCAGHPETEFLIDEAFADFSGETLLSKPLPGNVSVLRSMTKYCSVAGLRLGYLVSNPETVREIRSLQPPWSVGGVAFRAAEFLLKMPPRPEISGLREELAGLLRNAGAKVFPSCADYLLVKTPRPLFRELLEQRILVRNCANYPGLNDGFLRVAVRSRRENLLLADAFRGCLSPCAPALGFEKKTPALMIQGTCSNAGKSVLAAAFCRILLRRGYSVAPFKAQNMALNSAVTPDGGEIGRAQAVQAEACRIDPDVRMNPVLLKPESDRGSQVVLLGHPIGHFGVRDYFAKKKELWKSVTAAYDSLAAEHDCVVLEGAGSPGEVNLKAGDIVNMNMARYADSPVILAGDIDRGGVYASFLGTYATMEPWERNILYGFAVNKFRGDPSLLADAHDYLYRATGKKVLGVIDLLRGLALPEEDSVGFSFVPRGKKDARTLDVAVIRLGHIANFTDFAPFEAEPDVTLRIVDDSSGFGTPDLVILPGSKCVAEDLALLRGNGLFEAVGKSDSFVAGICGGLQILGSRILDPEKIESGTACAEGMNLLPVETVMRREKILRRTEAEMPDGTVVSGYEIHHGETRSLDPSLPVVRDSAGREAGYMAGRVFATYLHGVFDGDSFRRAFLNRIRARKGWAPVGTLSEYGIEPSLNRLADHVESRMDIPAILRKMRLG